MFLFAPGQQRSTLKKKKKNCNSDACSSNKNWETVGKYKGGPVTLDKLLCGSVPHLSLNWIIIMLCKLNYVNQMS